MAESTKKDARGQTPPPAQRFEILTPKNLDFAGERAGVRFVGGVGRTDDTAAAEECGRLGYAVRDLGHVPRFEVHTPPADSAFTGEKDGFEGVSFFKGVGRTDDEKLADAFAGAGFEVLEVTRRRRPAPVESK